MILEELTVGIPVYRSDKYLYDLVSAICNQEWKPKQIIICDDDVYSETEKIVIQLKELFKEVIISYHKNPKNLGIAGNYNQIISLTKTKWLHICDADDYPLDNFYKEIFEKLQYHPSASLLVGNMKTNSKIVTLIKKIIDLFFRFKKIPTWIPLLGSITTRSAIIYKTEILTEEKFIDPIFEGSDIVHLDKLRRKYNAVFFRNAYLFYRIHPLAHTSQKHEDNQYYLYILKNKKYLYIIDYFLRKKIFSFIRKS